MVISSEDLIEEIRKYNYLWDKGSNQYKDIKMKKNRFVAIATLFGSTGDIVAKKWKGLRDRYLKERREFCSQKTSGSGSDGITPPKWKLYKVLDGFLGSTVKPRETSSNVSPNNLGNDVGTSDKAQSIEANALFLSINGDILEDADGENSKDHVDSENWSFTGKDDPNIIENDILREDSPPSCSFSTASAVPSSNTSLPETSSSSTKCGMIKPPNSKRKRVDDMDLKMATLIDAATKNLTSLKDQKNSDESTPSASETNVAYFDSLRYRFNDLSKDKKREIRYKIEALFYEIESEV